MKKFIAVLLGASFLFASNSNIDQKLDLILQKMNQLEKQLQEKDKKIEMLQKEIQKQNKTIKQEITKTQKKVKKDFALRSCKNIKVLDLKYKYSGDLIPYYNLTYTLENKYPKPIVYLVGNLYAEDKDGVVILKDYVKRKVNIPVNGKVTIKKIHTLNGDLEKYLKDEDPKNLKLYFIVIKAEFSDGTNVECGIF